MIEIRLGYDNCQQGGTAQWNTLYIEDDFKTFYDYDGEKYYKNKLAPVLYSKPVQKIREKFTKIFKNINSIDDLLNNIGVLYLKDYETGFEYY